MSTMLLDVAAWLADVHLLSCLLLTAALAVLAALRQPARRMAIEKAALAGLAALAVLCALPGWSAVHLLTAAATPAADTAAASNGDQQITIPDFEFKHEEFNSYPVPPVPDAEALVQADAANAAPPAAASARPSVSWPTVLVALQAIGSAAVVAWLAMGALLVRRVRRETRLAPEELVVVLRSVVGQRTAPELCVSDRISAPVALGLRRPAIILPAAFATQDNPAMRSNVLPVLAHEWAHIANGDLRTLAASRWLLVLLWPQPLFWLLRRALRLDQETLADAAAAEVAGRVSYAEQLLGWARTATAPAPRMAGAVGLWEGPSQLKRRIATLLDEKLTVLRQCSRRWRVGAACTTLVVAALLSLVTLQRREAQAASDAEEAASTSAELANQAADADAAAAAHAESAATAPSDAQATISGRIVLEGGRPAPTKGELHSESSRDGNGYSSSTEGPFADAFEISVPAGTIWLKYFADDYAPTDAGPFELSPGEKKDDVELVLQSGFSAIIEVVDANGRPVPHAELAAFPLLGNSTDGPIYPKTLDDRGRVELAHLAEAPYQFRVRAPGFQPIRTEPEPVERDAVHRLVMERSRPTTGVVRDARGAPVEGAKLNCRIEAIERFFNHLRMEMATTDAEGRFRLDQLTDGADYGFEIVAPDGARLIVTDIVAGGDGIEYTMPACRDLLGRIRGDISQLYERNGQRIVSVRQRYQLQWGNDRGFGDLLGGDVIVTPTDGGGEFVYQGLIDGEVEVTAAGHDTFEFAVREDGDTEVTLDLRTEDAPAVPAASDASSIVDADEQDATSIANANYLLAMHGYRELSDPGANVFAGRCVDERGQPLAGVTLTLLRGQFWSDAPQVLGTMQSNERGEFRFEAVIDVAQEYPDGVIPTTHQSNEPIVYCTAQLPGRASRIAMNSQFAIPAAGRAVEFVMVPATTLRGRVTDERGRPIAGARVAKTHEGGKVRGFWAAESDANGEYEIADLGPFDFAAERRRQAEQNRARDQALAGGQDAFLSIGSMAPQFIASHPDFAFERLRPDALPGVANVVLRPGGRISGRVVTSDDQPAAGVEVRAYTSVPRQENDFGIPMFNHGAVSIDDMHFASRRTDADGRYEFAGLRPGQFDVWVETPGWFNRGHGEVAVTAGRLAEVGDLRLARGGTVRVKFVDAATGEPIPGDERLAVNVGLYHDDKLSRQEDVPMPTPTRVGPEGAAVVTARPGRTRVIVNQPLTVNDMPRWAAANGGDLMRAPVVDVIDGESVDVTIQVNAVEPVTSSEDTAGGEGAGHLVNTSPAPTPSATLMPPAVGGGGVLSGAEADFSEAFPPNQLRARFVADDVDDSAASDTLRNETPMADIAVADLTTVAEGAPEGAAAETVHSQTQRAAFAAVEEPGAEAPTAFGTASNQVEVHCVDGMGADLAGATVRVYRKSVGELNYELVRESGADDMGRARFADLLSDARVKVIRERDARRDYAGINEYLYLIAITKDGLATTTVDVLELDIAKYGYRPDVMVPAAQTLLGRVTSPDGRPVAGAVVVAGSHSTPIEGINVTRTDAEGRFEFRDRPPFDAEAVQAVSDSYGLTFAGSGPPSPAPVPSRIGEDVGASHLHVFHPDFAVTAVQGGNIPGTVDVTLLPAAAIAGRVVHSDTGAPIANMLVRASARLDMTLGGPDGRQLVPTSSGGDSAPFSHAAATRTSAEGRYRLDNLPPGAYDVWAAPDEGDLSQAKLFNRGISALAVPAGDEPQAAPDLVVGAGAVIRGQILEGETGEPLRIPGGGTVVLMCGLMGGPPMQHITQPRVPLREDGTFAAQAPPGRLHILAVVFSNSEEMATGRSSYAPADDAHATAPVIEASHFSVVDATFVVWSQTTLTQRRAAIQRARRLADERRFEEAIAAFNDALKQYPGDLQILSALAVTQERSGQLSAAAAAWENVLKVAPKDMKALMQLAEMLATSGDASVRNGARAVEVATTLVEVVRGTNVRAGFPLDRALMILAAAHAEAGNFEQAIAVQREAIETTPASTRDAFEALLRLYESGQPYRRKSAGP